MSNINVNVNTNVNNNFNDKNDIENKEIDNRAIIPNRGYLMNAENGLYLTDVDGMVVQELFRDGEDNQIWAFEKLEKNDTDFYSIMNEKSGNVISLERNGTENGMPIVTKRNISEASQEWRILTRIIPGEEAVRPGADENDVRYTRQIVSVYSSKAIDNPEGSIDEGTQMIQYTRKLISSENQVFFIVSICE